MTQVETLVEQHASEIHGYLCRMLGDHAAAKDVLGEVFLKMVEHVKKLESSDLCKTWLYKVATNCAISHMRRQRVRRIFSLREKHERIDAQRSPQDLIEMNEEAGRIRNAVGRLGKKHKSVLIMRIYQELSYQEIADVLKINIGTVKSRLCEAKIKISEMLEEKND